MLQLPPWLIRIHVVSLPHTYSNTNRYSSLILQEVQTYRDAAEAAQEQLAQANALNADLLQQVYSMFPFCGRFVARTRCARADLPKHIITNNNA